MERKPIHIELYKKKKILHFCIFYARIRHEVKVLGEYMKVLALSERELKRLPELQLSKKIVNTEAKLYLYEHKDKWYHLKELIKIYYIQNDEYMADKIYVVSQLIANLADMDLRSLVLPTSLVTVRGDIQGFSMPYIENNVNMSLLLGNPKVKLKTKLQYLREIFKILENIEGIKELEDNFFLGDIHEANFILDIDEQMIKAVDLDSAYINESAISVSKFLTINEKIINNPVKYPFEEKSDRPIPNHNTSILSFIYMLLNSLSGESSYRWSMEEYYRYLSYLKDLGCSNELVDSLSEVYFSNVRNNFSIELLDTINPKLDYSLKRLK